MPKPKITLKNIKSFLEGYSRYYYDEIIGLPTHIQEQIAYRHELCKDDCIPAEGCIHCGCNPTKKHFVTESCNGGERFPNLMGKDEWEDFKTNMNDRNIYNTEK